MTRSGRKGGGVLGVPGQHGRRARTQALGLGRGHLLKGEALFPAGKANHVFAGVTQIDHVHQFAAEPGPFVIEGGDANPFRPDGNDDLLARRQHAP